MVVVAPGPGRGALLAVLQGSAGSRHVDCSHILFARYCVLFHNSELYVLTAYGLECCIQVLLAFSCEIVHPAPCDGGPRVFCVVLPVQHASWPEVKIDLASEWDVAGGSRLIVDSDRLSSARPCP